MIHLIIYTDSLSRADVNTFQNAAKQLELDYQKSYQHQRHQIIVKKAFSGKDIVKEINSCSSGTIGSLDIVSHGNQGGIHIARKLQTPIDAGFIQRNAHYHMRRHSDRPQTAEDAEQMEESLHGLYSGVVAIKSVGYYYNQQKGTPDDTATLGDIDFSVFRKDAFVEFHGCRTAEMQPVLNAYLVDNFAANFSEKLPPKSTVIGHITNSKPNNNPNGNHTDYRFGKIRIYNNGNQAGDVVERLNLKFLNSSTPS
ncbi:hypothetical protein EZV61_13845 [Corallincola luteus]|uniref:Uncharacterized protein n=1 Tax=Corallincola luteus TaxID=1775177 RepID=A0ABY2AJB2_9GAMM|nr:hypothetical protein [Corallincola luteus]TCI02435.1 hypothetical protein EZV61_13845 [Corallincola luteus]